MLDLATEDNIATVSISLFGFDQSSSRHQISMYTYAAVYIEGSDPHLIQRKSGRHRIQRKAIGSVYRGYRSAPYTEKKQ